MLQMSIRNVAHQIVQHELLGKGREKEGLYLNFDLRMSHHTDRGSYDQSRGLHLLYYVHPHGTYVTVFASVTKSPFATLRDVKEWKHECTHDSCWRDINTFSQVYFDMAECINSALQKNKLDAIAPKDMHEYNSFGRSGLYEWVPVEVTKDPEDDRNYRRLVKVLR